MRTICARASTSFVPSRFTSSAIGSKRSSAFGSGSSRLSKHTPRRNMVAGDRVAVQTFVGVPIDVAFEVFTEEIDEWWRRGPAYRLAKGKTGTMRLEPKL